MKHQAVADSLLGELRYPAGEGRGRLTDVVDAGEPDHEPTCVGRAVGQILGDEPSCPLRNPVVPQKAGDLSGIGQMPPQREPIVRALFRFAPDGLGPSRKRTRAPHFLHKRTFSRPRRRVDGQNVRLFPSTLTRCGGYAFQARTSTRKVGGCRPNDVVSSIRAHRAPRASCLSAANGTNHKTQRRQSIPRWNGHKQHQHEDTHHDHGAVPQRWDGGNERRFHCYDLPIHYAP